MITITGFLHRNTLKQLITRWMYNAPDPADAEILSRLVHFNHAFVQRYLPVFSEKIFRIVYDGPLSVTSASCKADLKDVIVENLPYRNPRIDALTAAYRSDPGSYYRETPFQGMLYFLEHAGTRQYIGSNRIKRTRRLAEKSGRRIIDRMYADIKKRADALALDRARRMGISVDRLITPPAEMVDEFLKAEGRLLDDLKNRHPIEENHGMIIRDLAGVKIIVEDSLREVFFNRLSKIDGCRLVEREEHRGVYNAVNLILQYTPDREILLSNPLDPRTLEIMGKWGMDTEAIHRRFRDFVLEAEESVEVEIILCSYPEMLESEIGHSMHEERILRQRLNQQYTGQLARNIEFLLEYLFAFAESGRTELGALPIRLWDRYLPDYFDGILKFLYAAKPLFENEPPIENLGTAASRGF